MLLFYMEVFLFRMLDVIIGTLRTILIVKGKSLYAFIASFLEIFIWIFTIKMTISSMDIYAYMFYALGYAIGTSIGIYINKRIGSKTRF